jgi:hypothetical protein
MRMLYNAYLVSESQAFSKSINDWYTGHYTTIFSAASDVYRTYDLYVIYYVEINTDKK